VTGGARHVVGIDLGTTNSLVAYCNDGQPAVIRDSSGDALVPSIVSFDEDGTLFVGREAQRRLMTSPSRTVYSAKRFMVPPSSCASGCPHISVRPVGGT
jgi:molecular chaperone DnaK (HSP70)